MRKKHIGLCAVLITVLLAGGCGGAPVSIDPLGLMDDQRLWEYAGGDLEALGARAAAPADLQGDEAFDYIKENVSFCGANGRAVFLLDGGTLFLYAYSAPLDFDAGAFVDTFEEAYAALTEKLGGQARTDGTRAAEDGQSTACGPDAVRADFEGGGDGRIDYTFSLFRQDVTPWQSVQLVLHASYADRTAGIELVHARYGCSDIPE